LRLYGGKYLHKASILCLDYVSKLRLDHKAQMSHILLGFVAYRTCPTQATDLKKYGLALATKLSPPSSIRKANFAFEEVATYKALYDQVVFSYLDFKSNRIKVQILFDVWVKVYICEI
jgi:hypothetical protein